MRLGGKAFGLRRLRAVAFDLDRTLIRTSVDFKKMKQGIIRLFGAYGVDASLFTTSELTYTIVERGLNLLTSQGVSDVNLARINADITGIMNRVELESVSSVEAMPGVSEALLKIRDHGMAIGVITRGCRAYSLAALDRIGVCDMIDVILARDDVEKPKPDPSHLLKLVKRLDVHKDETVMVGDHRTDYLCAKAAHIQFIGISHGSSDLEELVKGDPRASIVRSLEDLPSFLFHPQEET